MLRKLICTLILAAFTLPCVAATKPKATPTPPPRFKEDTITAVSSTSITIHHTQVKKASKSKTASKGGGDVSTTYSITGVTDVIIDGKPAKVADLKVGMSVTVAADPMDGLTSGTVAKTSESVGGLARTITASGTIAVPTPTPAKKKK